MPHGTLPPLARAFHLRILEKSSLAMAEAVVVMPSVTCTRLSLGVGGRRLYVRTGWVDAEFRVTALDFPQAWSCKGECLWSFLFRLVFAQGNLGFRVDGWRQERGAGRIAWNYNFTIFFEGVLLAFYVGV